MKNKVIRIGTRVSPLALWQAQTVAEALKKLDFETTLIPIKSQGDIDLKTPLYEMGVQGIFTKTLDIALLNNEIDIAVHSLKDVPIQPAKGVFQAAVLKRGAPQDVLVFKDSIDLLSIDTQLVIATSSLRRKAQWLNRYPNHTIENLRGSINTRLLKLQDNAWYGAIFAAAGLERLSIRPKNSIDLDWMIPAPAQGAIGVFCRKNDKRLKDICNAINDKNTTLCTHIERMFLKKLMGGCSAPIAALATLENDIVTFKGCVLSLDGQIRITIEKNCPLSQAGLLGQNCAKEVLDKGADRLINLYRN